MEKVLTAPTMEIFFSFLPIFYTFIICGKKIKRLDHGLVIVWVRSLNAAWYKILVCRKKSFMVLLNFHTNYCFKVHTYFLKLRKIFISIKKITKVEKLKFIKNISEIFLMKVWHFSQPLVDLENFKLCCLEFKATSRRVRRAKCAFLEKAFLELFPNQLEVDLELWVTLQNRSD